MSRRIVSLAFIVALAFTSLSPGAAIAQSWRPGVRTIGLPAPVDLLARGWGLLARLWDKAGCLIDSSGLTTPGPSTQATPPTQGEEGCLIDPNGLCIKATRR